MVDSISSQFAADTCPLCGADSWCETSRVSGYRQGLEFRIYGCDACRCLSATPRQADDDIYRVIYEQPQCIPGYARYAGYADQVQGQAQPLSYLSEQEAGYWAIAEGLQRYLPSRDVSLLEIGCGMGYLTYALRRAGYRRVLGIDLSATAIAAAIGRYAGDYIVADAASFGMQTEERFDAVILSEVIEHLEDPVAILTAARELLKPGGCVICTTPSRDFGGAAGHPWATDLPPVHLWWFAENSMQVIAQRLAMRVDFTDFTEWNRRHYRSYCKALLRTQKTAAVAEPILDFDGVPRVPPPVVTHRPPTVRQRIIDGWRNAVYRLRFPRYWRGANIKRTVCIAAIFREINGDFASSTRNGDKRG